MAPGVEPSAGRAAADIIKNAQSRHVPILRVAEAARRAGITSHGWIKVINSGRGRQSTFLAMARVTGVEAEVRDALGMEPLEGDVVPRPGTPIAPPGRLPPAPRDVVDLDPFERSIAANPALSEHERALILDIYRTKGGRELLAAELSRLAELPREHVRQG
jgi:hypothetical protein